jgi:hypothetical protein
VPSVPETGGRCYAPWLRNEAGKVFGALTVHILVSVADHAFERRTARSNCGRLEWLGLANPAAGDAATGAPGDPA